MDLTSDEVRQGGTTGPRGWGGDIHGDRKATLPLTQPAYKRWANAIRYASERDVRQRTGAAAAPGGPPGACAAVRPRCYPHPSSFLNHGRYRRSHPRSAMVGAGPRHVRVHDPGPG